MAIFEHNKQGILVVENRLYVAEPGLPAEDYVPEHGYFALLVYFAASPTCMKTALLLLFSFWLLSCDPFNLERINFDTCAKPSASVGATITKLQADLFVDKSTGDINTVSWTFGDSRGLPQSGTRVSYTYDRPGSYTITMSLKNRCNQTFTARRTITVAN